MFLPIPTASLTNKIITSSTFLFFPNLRDLIAFKGLYAIYKGNKSSFTLYNNENYNLTTNVSHNWNFNTKLFTTSFETTLQYNDNSKKIIEFIHLTPTKPILKLERAIDFPNSSSSLYIAKHHLIKNYYMTNDVFTQISENNLTDTYDNIRDNFLYLDKDISQNL